MSIKVLTSGLIAAALVAAPVTRATAGGGDALVGGIIGGLIGGAIANDANKRHPRVVTRKVYRAAPAVDTAQRADNRQVQTALAYFGFDAGTPDGVMGRKSGTAISAYQMTLGYPATGTLNSFEHDFLLTSYNRAQAGGANTLAQIAQSPTGAAGLLITWRDEMAGGGVRAPSPAAVEAPAPAPAAPQMAAADPALAPLPNFMGSGGVTSVASHCNNVSLLTTSNGGFATLAGMSDPTAALDEQFCLARTYAIASGEDLTSHVQGVTPAAIEAQCKAFGPVMAPAVAALSTQPVEAVLTEAQGLARATGMAPAQLSGTAKICLSVGYRTDDMGVALGSALMLTALGEVPYGELLGHHLMRGFGTAPRPDLARDWFTLALDALKAGQPAVFAPGQPERADLIRAAVFGAPKAPDAVPAAAAGEAVKSLLKGFSINN